MSRFWWSSGDSGWTLTLEGQLAASRELGCVSEAFSDALLDSCANAANVADRTEVLRRVMRLVKHFS